MTLLRKGIGILIFSLSLSACTTLDSMKTSRVGEGVVQTYEVDKMTAFSVAEHALQVHGLEMDYVSADKDVIVANNGLSAMSYGERIGIYMKEEGDETEIRVVSKAKMKTNFMAPEWEMDIHFAIQNRLKQLKDAGRI